MAQGFNQVGKNAFVMRGVPRSPVTDHAVRQPEGDMRYAPHQGKGKKATAQTSSGVQRAKSKGGTAVT